MASEHPAANPHALRAEISRTIVRLLKEHYGRGPVKAKTYYMDDVVLILLGGGFTRVEATLHEAGRGQAVRDQRAAFQEAMRDLFSRHIERLTGRNVISSMSANDQDSDMTSQLFVLEPRPEIDEVVEEIIEPAEPDEPDEPAT
jgi:uncharacterized protein YbcI